MKQLIASQSGGETPAAAPPAAAKEPPKPEPKKEAPVQELGAEQNAAFGYKPVDSNTDKSGAKYFKKENGAAIKLNADGSWVASTPGHLTKEGTGLAPLYLLLSGKAPPDPKNLPWKNSGQSATPPVPEPEHTRLYRALSKAAPTPTGEEKKALGVYGGSGYTNINSALRNDPSHTNPTIKALDQYLARASIPEACTLYRGVKGDYAKILKSVVMEGTKFTDHGFSSTSTSEKVANNFESGLFLKINVPKGAKGASISDHSGHNSEVEILFARGSAYIVKSFDRKAGKIEVDLDQSHF